MRDLTSFTSFTWQVPRQGFIWLETAGGGWPDTLAPWTYGDEFDEVPEGGWDGWTAQRYITTGMPFEFGAVKAGHRAYSPFDQHPALFREFAELDVNEASVLRFANQYGPLGVPDYIVVESQGRQAVGHGEPLWLWEHAVNSMRWATERWREVAEGNMSPRIRQELSKSLAASVNAGLVLHCAPGLVFSEKDGRLRSAIEPTTLLGAMWLELMLAIDADTRVKRCEARGCPRWFLLEPPYDRGDKRFCSDACKAREYRARKIMARSMYSDGKSVEHIAVELDADPERVARWVKGEVK